MDELLGRRDRDCDCHKGCGGMDDSLLFFFLLLIIISCGDGLFGGFGKKRC